MFAYGASIEVLRAARDNHGDSTYTSVGVIDRCGVAPGQSTEDTMQRAQTDARCTVYATASGVQVSSQDRVRFLSGAPLPPDEAANLPLWTVDGTPERWANPFTAWRPGVVIHLSLVRG